MLELAHAGCTKQTHALPHIHAHIHILAADILILADIDMLL